MSERPVSYNLADLADLAGPDIRPVHGNLMASGKLDITKAVTKRIELDEMATAIEDTKNRLDERNRAPPRQSCGRRRPRGCRPRSAPTHRTGGRDDAPAMSSSRNSSIWARPNPDRP